MSYLRSYLKGGKLNQLTKECGDVLPFDVNFDTIAVRGNSGLLVGAVLAADWHMDIVIVRKDEKSHSGDLVEGWGKDQKILIVDDFIESGETVDLIYEALHEKCDNPEIVGILLYASTETKESMPTYTHADGTVFPVWNIKREE